MESIENLKDISDGAIRAYMVALAKHNGTLPSGYGEIRIQHVLKVQNGKPHIFTEGRTIESTFKP